MLLTCLSLIDTTTKQLGLVNGLSGLVVAWLLFLAALTHKEAPAGAFIR
jgi:hypothetical protein